MGSGHSKSQQKPISFCLPSPCLLGSQSMNRPLSSVLEHLLPGLIWIMKTWDKDTGWWPLICVGVVSSTEGSDSDRHSIFCNFWTCCDVSSLHEALQPTVYSESLVCNGCLFFGIFLFVCLSGKGVGIKIARGNFFCLQPRVFTGTLWTRPNRVHLPWKVVGRSALANWSIYPISQKEALLFPECESWQTDHFDQKKETGWP